MGIDSCIDKNNAAYRVLAIDRAMPQRAGLEVTDYDAYNLNHFLYVAAGGWNQTDSFRLAMIPRVPCPSYVKILTPFCCSYLIKPSTPQLGLRLSHSQTIMVQR